MYQYGGGGFKNIVYFVIQYYIIFNVSNQIRMSNRNDTFDKRTLIPPEIQPRRMRT